MSSVQDLDFYTLNDLILSQHYTDSAFRANWMNFRNYIGQFERDKNQLVERNIKHLLLDFYKQSFLRIKTLKTVFDHFQIDMIEDCEIPRYRNDNIQMLKKPQPEVQKIIKINVDKFINMQLMIVLNNMKQLA